MTVSADSTAMLSAQLGAGTLTIGVGDGGNLSIGVALASNTISGSTTATVDTSIVVGGSVAVTAEADATTTRWPSRFAVGIQASEGASLTLGRGGRQGHQRRRRHGRERRSAGGSVVVAAGTGTSDITVSATALSTLDATGSGRLAQRLR